MCLTGVRRCLSVTRHSCNDVWSNVCSNVNGSTDMCLTGVVSLAVGCRHLRVVYLRRCVNVGDDAVIVLASHCPQLTDLNIGGCALVTDASLQALAQHSCQLASINFSRAHVRCAHYHWFVYTCHAAILTGRTVGLAHPSVCLSVPYDVVGH